MKKTRLLSVLVPLLLSGCPRPQEPVGPDPVPEPKDTDMCLQAEQNLETLRCKDRAGDPMWVNRLGERFARTCEIAQEEGRIFLNPACVAGAGSCDEARKCPAAE